MDNRLTTALIPVLARLYPDGGPDPIAAATVAKAVEDAGWRWITAQGVEVAMRKVPNLVVEADSAAELAEALLAPSSEAH